MGFKGWEEERYERGRGGRGEEREGEGRREVEGRERNLFVWLLNTY